MTRATLEELVSDLIDRLVEPCNVALAEAELTRADIEAEFGPTVAELVWELTNQIPKDYGNRGARKAAEAQRLFTISADAQTIKYADIIDNIIDIVETDPEFAVVYLAEKQVLLDGMIAGDSDLRSRAMSMVESAQISLDKRA